MKKQKRIPFFISNRVTVIGAVFLVLLGFITIAIGRYRDIQYQKFLGDERSEIYQNKVPPDVKRWIGQGGVLGATTPALEIKILPKQLRVPILMFHYVEYVKDKGDTIRQSLDTTPYTFEEEIKTLVDAGYTFMTNSELADALDAKISLPPKPILLTFDDGYRDFYTDAYPVLKKYNVKATEYVITGFIGYPNNMTAEEIQEIATDGLVEIGAHTVDHANLKGMSEKRLVYEVEESKKTLEHLTGKPVVSFAYPYGAFDVPAIQEVAGAGFTSAVSTIPGADQLQIQRFFLYRLRSGGRTGKNLLSWLDSVKNEQISFNYAVAKK